MAYIFSFGRMILSNKSATILGSCSKDSVRPCRGEMTVDVEGVVDSGINEEKSLR
jgi:hypothetical protein